MLVDDEWKSKFINNDGSVEVNGLRKECRDGIKKTLRHIVYKILLLGFGSKYSEEIERKNIDSYERAFNAFQSKYLKGDDALTSQEESLNSFDVLMDSFPEYFSSKDKDEYVFVSNDKGYKTTSGDVDDYTSMPDNNRGKSQKLEDMESLPSIKSLVISIEDCKDISEKIRKNIIQIKKDIPRIPTECRKFECEGHKIDVGPIYENILIIYSVITDSPYIQGEWHMMTPFIYNFITYDCKREEDLRKVETNTFLCYTMMQKGIRKDIETNYANIIKDIIAMLKEKKPKLYERITSKEEIPIDGLLVRWIGTVFIPIFQLHRCQKIFDFLISYDPQDLPKLLKFLSVAIFVYHEKVIMEYEESSCSELFFNERKYFTNDVESDDINGIIHLACRYMDES